MVEEHYLQRDAFRRIGVPGHSKIKIRILIFKTQMNEDSSVHIVRNRGISGKNAAKRNLVIRRGGL